MKIAVVGSGYVGLVTAACFADSGHDVVGIDNDPAKVELLENGGIPIFEPELEEMIVRARENNAIRFTTDYTDGIPGAEAVFLCVGTPPKKDGKPNLDALFASAKSSAENADGPILMVVKSTVPVGTNEQVKDFVEPFAKHKIELASNPEFLKEGTAVDDFLRPDRVVIGVRSKWASELMHNLYDPFVRSGAPIIEVDPLSSEMGKYAANGMLAARISFMNEIARLCDSLGSDVENVRKIIGSDKRIGNAFLFAGPGYGGSCFPKDVLALMTTAQDNESPVPIIDAIHDSNYLQRKHLFDRLKSTLGNLSNKRIAVWGLTFKPRTDDVRRSPALDVIKMLLEEKASVIACDPEGIETSKIALGEKADKVEFTSDRYKAATDADALLLVTEWPEFRRPDPKKLASLMKGRNIFDWRNVLDGRAISKSGFTVYSLGRPTIKPEDIVE